MRKIFYYSDELEEDFATTVPQEKLKPLPKNYRFQTTSFIGRARDFFLYYFLAKPFAWLYLKIKFRIRFVGREVFKKTREGLFLYGNHTLTVGDALISNVAVSGRKNYILTGRQTNSLTPLLPIMRAVGNIPLSFERGMDMQRCIASRIKHGASVTIFPEAHVWPYYTRIRPFPAASFKFAAMNHAPAVCMTTCFQRRRHSKKPRITVYIDGPFYPDPTLTARGNAEMLRDAIFRCMTQRAETHSTYSYYTYQKADASEKEQDTPY